MNLKEHRELFKNKNFVYLWLEQIFTQYSYNLVNFTLIISVFTLTRSNLSVGVLLLCFYLPSAVFAIIAGITVDAVHRRKIIIMSNIIWALLVAVLFFTQNSFFAICLIAVLIQVTDEFFYNANSSSLPSVVEKSQLMSANSLFSATFFSCFILGSLSMGFITRFLSPGSPFLVSSLLVLTGAFLITKIKFEHKTIDFTAGKKQFSQRIYESLIEGWKYIKSNKTVTTISLFLIVANSLAGLFLAMAPGLLTAFGINAQDASFVLVLPLSIGLLIASLLISKYGSRYRKISIVQKGLFVFGLLMLLMAFIPRTEQLAVLTEKRNHFETSLGISLPVAGIVGLLGFFGTMIFVPVYTSLQEHVPEELRGRTTSTTQFITYLMSAVFAFSAGFISDKLGFFPILFTLSVATISLGTFSKNLLVKFRVLEK